MIRFVQFRSLLASLFAAALFSISVFAQTSQPWSAVRSKNFYLIGDASAAEIRASALRLEQFRQAFSQIFPTLRLDKSGKRTNVVVFKNAASYRPFKPKRADGTMDDHVVGYFQVGDDTNYITMSLPETDADKFGTIFHEYVHSLIAANFESDSLPTWLNEGLAEYFENLQVTNGRYVSVGGPRPEHLKLLRDSTPIPLSALFATDGGSLHRGGDDSRSLFYAESWALVYRLLNETQQSDTQRYESALSLIAGRVNPESSVRAVFGATDSEFVKSFSAFIERPPVPGSTVLLSGTVLPADFAVSTLSQAETDAYLGDLLFHTGRETEAADLLRKALAVDPRQTLAHASLGLMLMKQNRAAEAKPHLELAASDRDASAFVLFNYGYSIVCAAMDKNGEISEIGAERRQKIEAALQRAIDRMPGFAESYRLLAFVRMVDGTQLDEAAALARKAVELDPVNEEHQLLLAQVLLKQEKYGEAQDVADRLASLTSNVKVRADAREVVGSANEYFAANAETQKVDAALVGGLPPLILKRSDVTDADIARFEGERIVANLNRLLSRPRTGEKQLVGYLERIRCNDESIDYVIKTGGQRAVLTGRSFTDLRLSVITPGEQTFQIECGAGFGEQLAVMTFKPVPNSGERSRPELVSITFVPDVFRLMTPDEMAKSRLVVVEDDTLKRTKTSNPAITP